MRRAPVPFPSREQAAALPGGHRLVVPEEFTDGNGHMNIARYTQVHSDGGWQYFERFGLSEESAREGGPTTFDVEHHVRFHREVHAGHEVSVHVRLIERTNRAIHSIQFLVNHSTGEVANSHEAVSLSVDLATRSLTPIPDEIARMLDEQIALDTALDWPAPLCLSMGLRS